MVLDFFNIEGEDTRLIRCDNTVYKIKILPKSSFLLPCSKESAHKEIESVLRALLYFEQGFVILKPIHTEHFIVTAVKKTWKTWQSLDFYLHGEPIKACPFQYILKVDLKCQHDIDGTSSTCQTLENRSNDQIKDDKVSLERSCGSKGKNRKVNDSRGKDIVNTKQIVEVYKNTQNAKVIDLDTSTGKNNKDKLSEDEVDIERGILLEKIRKRERQKEEKNKRKQEVESLFSNISPVKKVRKLYTSKVYCNTPSSTRSKLATKKAIHSSKKRKSPVQARKIKTPGQSIGSRCDKHAADENVNDSGKEKVNAKTLHSAMQKKLQSSPQKASGKLNETMNITKQITYKTSMKEDTCSSNQEGTKSDFTPENHDNPPEINHSIVDREPIKKRTRSSSRQDSQTIQNLICMGNSSEEGKKGPLINRPSQNLSNTPLHIDSLNKEIKGRPSSVSVSIATRSSMKNTQKNLLQSRNRKSNRISRKANNNAGPSVKNKLQKKLSNNKKGKLRNGKTTSRCGYKQTRANRELRKNNVEKENTINNASSLVSEQSQKKRRLTVHNTTDLAVSGGGKSPLKSRRILRSGACKQETFTKKRSPTSDVAKQQSSSAKRRGRSSVNALLQKVTSLKQNNTKSSAKNTDRLHQLKVILNKSSNDLHEKSSRTTSCFTSSDSKSHISDRSAKIRQTFKINQHNSPPCKQKRKQLIQRETDRLKHLQLPQNDRSKPRRRSYTLSSESGSQISLRSTEIKSLQFPQNDRSKPRRRSYTSSSESGSQISLRSAKTKRTFEIRSKSLSPRKPRNSGYLLRNRGTEVSPKIDLFRPVRSGGHESQRLEKLRNTSYDVQKNKVSRKQLDRHLVENEEIDESVKLQTLSKPRTPSPGQRKSPRKRRPSGLWDFIDTNLITPVKKVFKR